MRTTVSLLALVALAACSKADNESSSAPSGNNRNLDVAEEAASGPNVSPTAAPGVAFNYHYAFRLQAARIAEVQEQHAQACEKLGIDRCRITGMRYRLVNDRDIEAMLAFKLDPSLARAFGKQGIDAVGKAEDMLVDSEISGEDVGSQIAAGERQNAEMREDADRVEAKLKQPGLKSSERVELQQQADRLRETIRANQTTQGERRESLATTPMVFEYGSGKLAPGFDTRPSVIQALQQAGDNFVDGVSMLLVLLVTLTPWGVALALVIWIIHRLRRRFGFSRLPDLEAAA